MAGRTVIHVLLVIRHDLLKRELSPGMIQCDADNVCSSLGGQD